MTSLNLTSNGIGTEGAAILAAALEKNSTLTSIDLHWNGIGNEGAASLAAALEKNYAMEVLNFDCPGEMRDQVKQLLARNVARYQSGRAVSWVGCGLRNIFTCVFRETWRS